MKNKVSKILALFKECRHNRNWTHANVDTYLNKRSGFSFDLERVKLRLTLELYLELCTLYSLDQCNLLK